MALNQGLFGSGLSGILRPKTRSIQRYLGRLQPLD